MAYEMEGGKVVAVAGYRISTNMWLGKHLYIDDLVTSSKARSKGHGEALISWLREQAKAVECKSLDLDSGTHRGRAQARFLEPVTRRFLIEAGITQGMRVLDVGSGAGEVAFLVAELVGEAGIVLGHR